MNVLMFIIESLLFSWLKIKGVLESTFYLRAVLESNLM